MTHIARRVLNVGQLAALTLLSSSVYANGATFTEAEVVAVEPLYRTVTTRVPIETCYEEEVAYREPGRRSPTVPIIGALVGGALGNALGSEKRNKQVGAVVGAVVGGSVAADVQRRRSANRGNVRYRTEQVCNVSHEVREEERPDGYRVSYLYGGETYTTRLDHDPGDRIRVRVQVNPVY